MITDFKFDEIISDNEETVEVNSFNDFNLIVDSENDDDDGDPCGYLFARMYSQKSCSNEGSFIQSEKNSVSDLTEGTKPNNSKSYLTQNSLLHNNTERNDNSNNDDDYSNYGSNLDADSDTDDTDNDQSNSSSSRTFEECLSIVRSQSQVKRRREKRAASLKLSIRKSDENLFNTVRDLAFNRIQYEFKCQCSPNNNCIGEIPSIVSEPFRMSFWGDKYPSSSIRRAKFRSILEDAHTTASCIKSAKQFIFKIGNYNVCEMGFLTMLGFIQGKPQIWRRVKCNILNKKLEREANAATQSRNSPMFDHATSYILHFIETECDKRPDSPFAIVPYTSVKQFHADYQFLFNLMTLGKVETTDIACESTFRAAFKSLHKNEVVHLMRQVGGFATCETCNNISELLRNGRAHYSAAEQKVFVQYRREHLQRQGDERLNIEKIKVKCREVGANGQPLALYLNADAITERRGNVPINRTEGGRHSKRFDSNSLTNRVIAVEVICGDKQMGGIEGFMLYITDDYLPKGANTMIEVIRQALHDVEEILARKGWTMPRTLHLQYDNSGENKNKYNFTYLSGLVEFDYFEVIYIWFLIVGHTHNSVDQYFSVLSKLLFSIFFCGSPLALAYLLANYPVPLPILVKNIDVIYNVDTAMNKLKVINNTIKYYLVSLVQFNSLLILF